MNRRATLLPWVIAFKAFKAITLTALGIALFVARGTDPLDVLVRMALAFHLPMTSALFVCAYKLATRLAISHQTALANAATVGYLWKQKEVFE